MHEVSADAKDKKARNLICRVGPENVKGEFRRTEWRALIRKGTDPREVERRDMAEVTRKRDVTFGAVIEDYLSRHVKGKRKAKDVEREIPQVTLPPFVIHDIRRTMRTSLGKLTGSGQAAFG